MVRRFVVALAASALLAPAVVAGAGPAAAEVPVAKDVTVPANVRVTPEAVAVGGAGTDGVLLRRESLPGWEWHRYAGGTVRLSSSLTAALTSAADVVAVPTVDAGGAVTSVTLRDFSGGGSSSRSLDVPTGSTYVGGLASSIAVATADGGLALVRPGGVASTDCPTGTFGGAKVQQADASAALVRAATGTWYVDEGSGACLQLPGATLGSAMTANRVVWVVSADGTTGVVRQSARPSTTSPALQSPPAEFSVTGDLRNAVAVVGGYLLASKPSGRKGYPTAWRIAALKNNAVLATFVLGAMGLAGVSATTDVVTVEDSDIQRPGAPPALLRRPASAPTSPVRLDLLGTMPATVTGVAVSGRRLVTRDNSASPAWIGAWDLSDPASAQIARPASGSARTITVANAVPLVSGQYAAMVLGSASTSVYLFRGATLLRTIPVISDQALVGLSGSQVLVENVKGTFAVVEGLTGATLATVTAKGTPALSHGVLYYVGGTNKTIRARNVATGSERTVGTATCVQGLQAAGPFVLSPCGPNPLAPFANEVFDTAASPATKTVVTGKEMRVGDGFVVYRAADAPATGDADLLWSDVTGGVPRPDVLQSLPVTAPFAVDADGGQTVAVVDAGAARVHSIPVAATAARLERSSVAGGFSPNGDGQLDRWTATWTTSAPVSWTLSIGSGATGTTLRGTSVGNAVDVAWDGKDGATALPPGTYPWTLRMSPTTSNAADLTQNGSLVLRNAPVAVTGVAPARSSDVSRGELLPVSWTPAAGGVTSYDVWYRYVTVSSAGSRVYGPWTTWLSRSAARSAVFGAGGSPIPPIRGRQYQFAVRAATDAYVGTKPGPWTYLLSTVPYDDRDPYGISWGTGWTAQSGASLPNHYRASRHVATTGGLLTVTQVASSIAVIGDKCSVCGTFNVYVDGFFVGQVNTRSATAAPRQVLWSRTFPEPLRRHSVQVSAVRAPGTFVGIDAIAVGR